MNEDLFIILTQILEKLDSIDVRLKNIECGSGNNCEPIYEEPITNYCDTYCEPTLVYPIDTCVPYYCNYIYEPYYDYTLDYLIPMDEYCSELILF